MSPPPLQMGRIEHVGSPRIEPLPHWSQRDRAHVAEAAPGGRAHPAAAAANDAQQPRSGRALGPLAPLRIPASVEHLNARQHLAEERALLALLLAVDAAAVARLRLGGGAELDGERGGAAAVVDAAAAP